MFAAHPHLCVMPETSALRRLAFSGKLSAIYEREGQKGLDQIIQSDERLSFLGVDLATCTRQAVVNGRFNAIVWYKQLLSAFRGDSQDWLVDKDPKLIEFLPALAHWFPNCSVIHVIRDPRDVLVSRKKAAWSRGRPWWVHVLTIQSQYTFGVASGSRLFGDRYCQVYYEQLIEDPEMVLQLLCDRLGLPFDVGMLDFKVSAASLIRPSEMSWKAKTLESVDAENKLKWKTGLSAFETAVCELTCATAIDVANYERSTSMARMSLAAQFFALPVSILIRAAGRALRLGLSWRARRLCQHLITQ